MVIFIDGHKKEAVRCDVGEARQLLIGRLRDRLSPDSPSGSSIAGTPIFGEDILEGTIDSAFDEFLPDDGELTASDLSDVFDDYVVVDDAEEGSEGVAVGFSSADRCSFAFAWPAEDKEEFLGNGDPMVYKTAGKPEGEVVMGEEVILPEDDEDDEDDE